MPAVPSPENKRLLAAAPAYRRIDEDLRARLRAGEWPGGAMLPSRRELAREYGVEVMTIQRAIAGLLSEGILRADGGRGTFVATAPALPREEPVGVLENGEMTAPRSTILVGLVDRTYSLGAENPCPEGWNTAVSHALERSFANEPGFFVQAAAPRTAQGQNISVPEMARTLLEAGVSALVLVFTEDSVGAVLSVVDTERIPVVFVGSRDIGVGAMNVFYDSHSAGYQACRHLLDQGYEKLLFLSPFEADFMRARLEGAREAIQQHGGPNAVLREFIETADVNKLSDSHEHLASHMAEELVPTLAGQAVIAVNDSSAIGVMKTAASAELKAGVDYGIVGFDDIPESRVVGLSSYHPPLDAMGAEAGRLVREALRGHKYPMQVRLRSYLIQRSSTSRLA